MTDVFICNAPEDRDTCAPYVAALAKRGVDVWFESKMVEDDNLLSEDTRHHLEEASTLIVFLTPGADVSIRASYQTIAYSNLLIEGKPGRILAVRISDSKVPKLLKPWPLVDAVDKSVDETAEGIIASLENPSNVSSRDIFASILGSSMGEDLGH